MKKCPYYNVLFRLVPGYVSGYGCPICKGLSDHLEIEDDEYDREIEMLENRIHPFVEKMRDPRPKRDTQKSSEIGKRKLKFNREHGE